MAAHNRMRAPWTWCDSRLQRNGYTVQRLSDALVHINVGPAVTVILERPRQMQR